MNTLSRQYIHRIFGIAAAIALATFTLMAIVSIMPSGRVRSAVASGVGVGTITHTTVADFTPCTFTDTVAANTAGGELRLAAYLEDYFDGSVIDTSKWLTNSTNASPDRPLIGGGIITVMNTYLRSWGSVQVAARDMVMRARLTSSVGFADIGLGRLGQPGAPGLCPAGFDCPGSNRLFTAQTSGNSWYANARDGYAESGGPTNTLLSGVTHTEFHDYRIDWGLTQTTYYIDDVLYPTATFTSATSVTYTPYVWLYNDHFDSSRIMEVDYVRVNYYPSTSGQYLSCAADSGQQSNWTTFSWTSDLPSGTSVSFETRSSDDGSAWGDWAAVASSGDTIANLNGRYLQYRTAMTTTDDKVSPEIGSVVIGYELNEDPVANAGGPYVVAENVSLMLNGSASSDPNSDAITYEWDFDYDGSFDVDSTAISPSITYPDGLVTMTVALRVTDESDATHVNTTTVTVNNIAPTSVAGSDQIVNEGDTVNFSGSGTDVPSDTLSYDWDFDYDNITFNIDDSGTNVSTSYADGPATYTVALRVSDDDGGATVDTLTVTVNNVNPEVYVGLDLMGDEGSLIAFSAVITDVGSADTHTYEWDFGDGVTSTLATPSHSYADNGVYLVMLTVLDDDNGVGVDTLNVTVSNVDPVVEVGPNLSGDEGSVIAFSAVITDSGSADTHIYDWDFGDGNSSTQAAPSHTYADNGVYNVTLMVLDDDGGGPAVDSLTVTVDNVAPTVEIGSDKNVGEGTIVPFSAIVTDPGSGDTHIYDWSFGDGNSSTQAAPSHTFADNGVYTVTLTLSDDDGGGPAVDQLVVTVTNVDPVIDAGSYTAAGGDMVIFSVAIIDAAGDTHTIEWDLDFNGSYETVSASPSRSYILAGTYPVGVRVTDDDGAIVTDTAQVTITSNSPTAFSIYIPFTARSYDSAGSSVARPTGNQSSFNIVIWWATLIQQMMSR